jgi:hypothetical protein
MTDVWLVSEAVQPFCLVSQRLESVPARKEMEGQPMPSIVYVSKVSIERKSGPLRVAHLPGETQPVLFSVHGAIAEHYGVAPEHIRESHASTLDYVVAALGG